MSPSLFPFPPCPHFRGGGRKVRARRDGKRSHLKKGGKTFARASENGPLARYYRSIREENGTYVFAYFAIQSPLCVLVSNNGKTSSGGGLHIMVKRSARTKNSAREAFEPDQNRLGA